MCDRAAGPLQEVVHVLDVARIVAPAADTPLADRELLALAAGELDPGAQPPGAALEGLVAETRIRVVIVADADVGDRRVRRVEGADVHPPLLGHEPADAQAGSARLHRPRDAREAGLPLLGRFAGGRPREPVAGRFPAQPDLGVAHAVVGQPAGDLALLVVVLTGGAGGETAALGKQAVSEAHVRRLAAQGARVAAAGVGVHAGPALLPLDPAADDTQPGAAPTGEMAGRGDTGVAHAGPPFGRLGRQRQGGDERHRGARQSSD